MPPATRHVANVLVAANSAPWSKTAMVNPMQDAPILQDRLPLFPWADPATRRLPGIQPVQGRDWLRVDEAYAPQMALRDRLIAGQPEVVHALLPKARPAADELYATVLDWLRDEPGFAVGPEAVTRPDGVSVPLDPAEPLLTLGRLVQQDLCLMESSGSEYDLTGAILCFPASWTLAQKIGRPMTGIHQPVEIYDEALAARVHRLLSAIRPEQPLWRMNFFTYDDYMLHHPRVEGDYRRQPTGKSFVRCERQTLLRLAETQAVVFAIHTIVVDARSLDEADYAALHAARH
jgi:dimethylamine monooxygenase subunit A